jgi:hypothetical protein
MTDLDTYPPAIAPALSQGTTIEQSRAVAQVQAMVIVAQQVPRDMSRVVADMRETCGQLGLAERAFYRFPRAKSVVTGSTIHLARELARVFRNMDYGITELARDDDAGRSEMLAYAYDLQANTRAAQIFIVPHKRDTKDGAVALPDLRDIYEQTTNQAARRLRQQIYAMLPTWLVREAEDRCRATLESGGGKSLAQRTADAVGIFEDLGVSLPMLETKLGKRAGEWTAFDIAQLGITYRAVRNGEVTVEQEFTSSLTGDILAQPAPVVTREPADLNQDDWSVDLAAAEDALDLQAIEELQGNATAAGRTDLADQAAAALTRALRYVEEAK